MIEMNNTFQKREYDELLAHITNYESINEVFIDGANSFQKHSDQMQKYIDSLKKVIIYGSKEDSEKAKKLCQAIETTLKLLNEISQKLK